MTEITAERFTRLRNLNLGIGLAHAAQGALILAMSNEASFPITAGFLKDDPMVVTGAVPTEVIWNVRIGPAVAIFLFLAAIDHLLVAFPFRGWYEDRLRRRANTARWIEYAISASLMIVLIASFTGVRDLAAVLAIFAVNSAMILFGWLMEKQQDPDNPDWTAFWFGSLMGAVPWTIITIYLLSNVSLVPSFVFIIYFVELVLFMSFAVNMYLQYAQVGKWRDYVYGESAYTTLSIVSKSLLAWLVFANVLRS